MTQSPNSQSPNLPTSQSTNPYVGPRTFSAEQRHLFFGREREARDLLARVLSERLLLFYAQSGAGKSSLLRTRLIPQLQEEKGFVVLPVGRVSGELPAGVGQVDNIFVFNLLLSIDEGADPARLAHVTLADFLARLTRQSVPDAEGRERRGWVYDAAATAAAAAPGSHRYALVVDQFEEIITSHPGRWRERETFFRQLDAAMRADPNLWVVLTLREDYVAALDPYAPFVADRLRARFYMERMGVPAALDAIRQPASLAGRPFAEGVAEQLADELRQVRVAGQETTVAGQYVEPVQLQVVCYQLWEGLREAEIGERGPEIGDWGGGRSSKAATGERRAITFEDLARAGDVDRALTQFYEETLAAALADPAAAGVSERQMRSWFDEELITEEGTRGLVHQGESDAGGLPNAVVRALQRRFLVRAEARGGDSWIELVHDRFVEPIRASNAAWFPQHLSALQRQAALWDEQGRSDGLLLSGKVLAEAEAWAAARTEPLEPTEQGFLAECRRTRAIAERERQQSRRIRMLALMAAAVAVVAVVFAVFGVWGQQRASRAERAAQAERAIAQGNANLAATREAQAQLAEGAAVAAKSTAEAEAQRAETEAQRAAKQARLAQAGELSSYALSAIRTNPEDPDLALLLARQAVTTTLVPDGSVSAQARDALAKAMAAVPPWRQLFSLASTQLQVALFSATYERLATVDNSGFVKLYDTATGEEIGSSIGIVSDGVAFSDDGALLAVFGEILEIYDATTGLQLHYFVDNQGLDIPFIFHSGKFSPDGTRLLSYSSTDSRYTAILWDLETSTELARVNSDVLPDVFSLPDVWFSPNGSWMFLDMEGSTHLLRTDTGAEVSLANPAEPGLVEFSRSGSILTIEGDNEVQMWDTRTGAPLTLFGSDTSISAVSYTADHGRLAILSKDGRAGLLLDDENHTLLPLDQQMKVTKIEFSSTGRYLILHTDDAAFHLLETDSRREIRKIEKGVLLKFDNSDDRYILGEDNGNMRLVEAETGASLRIVEGVGKLTEACFNSDGRRLVIVGSEFGALTWNLEAWDRLLQVSTALYCNLKLVNPSLPTFSPDGRYLQLYTADGVQLWDIKTRQQLFMNAGFQSASFSSDGHRAIVTLDNGATVWDSSDAQYWLSFGDAEQYQQLEVSDDGRFIAAISKPSELMVWDGVSGQLLITSRLGVPRFWLSPDGEHLLMVGTDRRYHLWDVLSGKEQATLGALGSRIGGIYSPDSRLIAIQDKSGARRIWDSTTGIEISSLGVVSDTNHLSFSSDSRLIAVVTENGLVRVWQSTNGQVSVPGISLKEGTTAEFNKDGSLLAVFNRFQRPVGLIDIHQKEARLQGVAPGSSWVKFSPDFRFLVTQEGSREDYRIWETQTGQELIANARPFDLAYFDRASGWLVTRSTGGVRIWDLPGERELLQYASPIDDVVFSRNRDLAVTFRQGSAPRAWSLASGELLYMLPEGTQAVFNIWGDRNDLIAAYDVADNTLRVLDATTGKRRVQIHVDNNRPLTWWSDDSKPPYFGLGRILEQDLQDLRLSQLSIGRSYFDNYVAFDYAGFSLWDLRTGSEVWHFRNSGWYLPFQQTQSGQYVLLEGGTYKPIIWPLTPQHLLDLTNSLIRRDPPLLTPEERQRYGLE